MVTLNFEFILTRKIPGAVDDVKPITIVGEEQKAFGGEVKAAHRMNALRNFVQILRHGGASFGVFKRAQNSHRFIKCDVNMLHDGWHDEFAIHFDGVAFRIDFGA